MIVEIAGRPAEHVLETLKAHIGQLKNYKDINYISESFSEPKRLEAEQEIYTSFAEIEFEAESFLRIMDIVFDFMPSSIEILEPSELNLNLSDATTFLNNLAGRLHRYDEIAKIARMQVNQLAGKLQELQKTDKIQDNKLEVKKPKSTKKKTINKSKKTKKSPSA